MNETSDALGSATDNWQITNKDMLAPASEAVAHIHSNQRIFIGTGCAQPQALVDALLARATQLHDIEIILLLTFTANAYRHADLASRFRLNRFFVTETGSGPDQGDLCDCIPISLSDIPELFHSGQLPIDVALIQTTLPNELDMCSLGLAVDITKSALQNARLVIAQVNAHMPWTFGDSLVSIDEMDILVPDNRPLLEFTAAQPSDTEKLIGANVAALIPNGSTLAIGTRPISLAVLEHLHDKHDLGIHTEVLGDTVIDLIESGVITGTYKSMDRGKVVATLCLGTQPLFEYIHRHPGFSLRPAEYVSDPHLISQQHHMVAISVAVEVDLSGQVCAHSREGGFSVMGGHSDFVHGAVRAQGGKLIIALRATRNEDRVSQIVPCLSHGAEVTATRSEVHYVVTEYGVAYLYGKSLQERALALISIAAPQFRAELLRAAIAEHYVSSELDMVRGKIEVGLPAHRASMVLSNGTQINFRPMHLTDEKRVRELFYNVSQQSLYLRFMSHITLIPRKQIQEYVYIDYRSEMAIVGTIPEAHGEDIVAIGRYYLLPPSNRAEVAFTVRDAWQNQGIGTFLLEYLITIAKRNGITGFTAEVLTQNRNMLSVFRHCGHPIRSHADGSVYSLTMDFT